MPWVHDRAAMSGALGPKKAKAGRRRAMSRARRERKPATHKRCRGGRKMAARTRRGAEAKEKPSRESKRRSEKMGMTRDPFRM